MTIEDRLRRALAEEAASVPAPPDRWDEVEMRAAAAHRAGNRRSRQLRAGVTIVAVAAAVTTLLAVAGLWQSPSRRVGTTPGSHPQDTVSPAPTPPASPPPTTPATPTTTGTAPSATSSTTQPASAFGYQALWPFRSLTDVGSWQAAYRSGGSQPWHLDPAQTALGFTRGFLGYTDIDKTYGNAPDAAHGAHVTVGFDNPNGQPVKAAVIHLVRFGTGADAPWEVVGTDDGPDFSLDMPAYGAGVSSPLTVGGKITGVDESITVQVLQQSSTAPLGTSVPTPAGGTRSPWTTVVNFKGATDQVLTIAASTGGHLARVERFTVTGVR